MKPDWPEIVRNLLTALPDSRGLGGTDNRWWRSLTLENRRYVKRMRREAEAAIRKAERGGQR
ncbi:MAG TPA: hypothetical protein VJK02_21245 [Anaerolineales bacterium]|nr:hypothetical protein [Anaerolineales bacterium]